MTRTTATADDASISDGVRTAKYAIFAIKYTTVTIEMDITMARGRFLKKEQSQHYCNIFIYKKGKTKTKLNIFTK